MCYAASGEEDPKSLSYSCLFLSLALILILILIPSLSGLVATPIPLQETKALQVVHSINSEANKEDDTERELRDRDFHSTAAAALGGGAQGGAGEEAERSASRYGAVSLGTALVPGAALDRVHAQEAKGVCSPTLVPSLGGCGGACKTKVQYPSTVCV